METAFINEFTKDSTLYISYQFKNANSSSEFPSSTKNISDSKIFEHEGGKIEESDESSSEEEDSDNSQTNSRSSFVPSSFTEREI